jgi:hypothetical protein
MTDHATQIAADIEAEAAAAAIQRGDLVLDYGEAGHMTAPPGADTPPTVLCAVRIPADLDRRIQAIADRRYAGNVSAAGPGITEAGDDRQVSLAAILRAVARTGNDAG